RRGFRDPETTGSRRALKAATTAIPIVFTTSSDPVELGLATSLNRPGGNLTGATNLNIEVTPKRLEILHELLPAAKRFVLLVNPTNPYAELLSRHVQNAARTLGVEVDVLQASTEGDFDLTSQNAKSCGFRELRFVHIDGVGHQGPAAR